MGRVEQHPAESPSTAEGPASSSSYSASLTAAMVYTALTTTDGLSYGANPRRSFLGPPEGVAAGRTSSVSRILASTPPGPQRKGSGKSRDSAKTSSTSGYASQYVTSHEFNAFIRGVINLLGSILFFVGSLLWVIDDVDLGNIIFASANFCFIGTGIWWAISAYVTFHRHFGSCPGSKSIAATEYVLAAQGGPAACSSPSGSTSASSSSSALSPAFVLASEAVYGSFHSVMLCEILGAMLQVFGAIAFSTGCLTATWGDAWARETISFWAVGSACFVGQGVICQIVGNSFWGPLGPLIPKCLTLALPCTPSRSRYPECTRTSFCPFHKIVPGSFFATFGSILFLAGSICLPYTDVAYLGGWGYTVGSALFVLATYSDMLQFLDLRAQRKFAKRA